MLAAIIFFPGNLSGQKQLLRNPSFEGEPPGWHTSIKDTLGEFVRIAFSFDLRKWHCTGDPTYSPPDVISADYHCNDISVIPQDGFSCISLVVRPDGSYEGVTQRLRRPLSSGLQYQFVIWACQSRTFRSGFGGIKDTLIDYTAPVIVRVLGGNANMTDYRALVQSAPIGLQEWTKLAFTFSPDTEYESIAIEAFYPDSSKISAGHVLLDNAFLGRLTE